MEYSNLGKKRGKGTPLYGSIIENADYLIDLEMSNQSKKRIRVDVQDSKWNENYLSFMVDLENYCEANFVKEDDEEDPLYAKFLENLKEHGKCYMLDVSVEHGVCSPIIYEVETVSSVLAGRKSPRTRQGTCTRKEGRLDVDKQLKSHVKAVRVKKLTTRACQGTYIRKEGSFEDKRELKSGLKKGGFAKEVETDSLDAMKRETSRTRHGYNMRKKRGLEGESQLKSGLPNSPFVCKVEKDPLDVIEKTSISRQGCSGVNRQLKCSLKKSGVDEDEADPSQVIKRKTLRTRQDSNTQKKGDLHAGRPVKVGCGLQEKRAQEKAQEADETYNSFFAGLKVVEDSMVYEFGDYQQVFYEGSVQQTSTPSPAIPTPLSPTANHKMKNTSVKDNGHDKNGKNSQKDHSKLWRELRGILGKPFDQNEFDDLWKEMSSRSQIQIYRDSRSGGTYRPGHMGRSYLDKYPELNDEIKKAKSDPRKVLNLLRMLHFYLTNVPHGIPPPWSPNCRKMFLP